VEQLEKIESGHWLCIACQLELGAATQKSVEHIYSKIVGVSHQNPNGTERQWLIQNLCQDGMPLQLVPEPYNEHDPNAIRVEIVGRQLEFPVSDN
jgi:hypothetical protein